ncbi:MAG: hypothetical protein ACOVSW_12425 [Candidatus Kapaibacteriota bacterium]
MNNDELLAMYLDGTLSEGERTDFNRLLQTSPTFATEAREILTIQGMLFAPESDDERTAAFLRSIEDNLATAIIATGAAATVGTIATAVGKSALASTTAASTSAASIGASAGAAGATAGSVSWVSSLLSTAFASTTSMVVSAGIGISALAGGATATYYVVKNNAAESNIAEKQVIERSISVSPSQGTNLEQQAAASTASPTPSSETTSNANGSGTPQTTAQRQADVQNGTSAPTSNEAASTANPREYTARISGGNMQQRYAAAIGDYTKQLQAKEASNDRAGAAFVEKSLGVLLRQAGQLRESRLHLSNTAKAAHSLGLQELEGEALAELALVDAAEGKKDRATQGLQTALGILNTAKSTTAQRWQKELEKLTGK